jgi:hypothetical protein
VVPARPSAALDALAREALTIGDIRSSAIFAPGDATSLQLVAAAGIEGPPLDALVAAVQQPSHPVARALHDQGPTFDVLPINPGGPRLRSHLPLRLPADARGVPGRSVGVLALAHDEQMELGDRERLVDLARRAGEALGDDSDPG